ncbi:hypothetical protein ACFQY4_14820 [Catellatospora bangladeshensis]|uniref:hypothetical protein n=1 Tax=Catellatospora bangladeshensis TaxID=310355 RepID=UPI0036108380
MGWQDHHVSSIRPQALASSRPPRPQPRQPHDVGLVAGFGGPDAHLRFGRREQGLADHRVVDQGERRADDADLAAAVALGGGLPHPVAYPAGQQRLPGQRPAPACREVQQRPVRFAHGEPEFVAAYHAQLANPVELGGGEAGELPEHLLVGDAEGGQRGQCLLEPGAFGAEPAQHLAGGGAAAAARASAGTPLSRARARCVAIRGSRRTVR